MQQGKLKCALGVPLVGQGQGRGVVDRGMPLEKQTGRSGGMSLERPQSARANSIKQTNLDALRFLLKHDRIGVYARCTLAFCTVTSCPSRRVGSASPSCTPDIIWRAPLTQWYDRTSARPSLLSDTPAASIACCAARGHAQAAFQTCEGLRARVRECRS